MEKYNDPDERNYIVNQTFEDLYLKNHIKFFLYNHGLF